VQPVPREGAGTTYGWENVVQLQNLTGLNFSTMVTNGNIIVE
jgi:hypothetical protein